MDKFEEIGKRIDAEMERLRRYVDEEIAPETERPIAAFALCARRAPRLSLCGTVAKPILPFGVRIDFSGGDFSHRVCGEAAQCESVARTARFARTGISGGSEERPRRSTR